MAARGAKYKYMSGKALFQYLPVVGYFSYRIRSFRQQQGSAIAGAFRDSLIAVPLFYSLSPTVA
jgi:hypothetical protein